MMLFVIYVSINSISFSSVTFLHSIALFTHKKNIKILLPFSPDIENYRFTIFSSVDTMVCSISKFALLNYYCYLKRRDFMRCN